MRIAGDPKRGPRYDPWKTVEAGNWDSVWKNVIISFRIDLPPSLCSVDDQSNKFCECTAALQHESAMSIVKIFGSIGLQNAKD